MNKVIKKRPGQAVMLVVFLVGMGSVALSLAMAALGVTQVQISENTYSSKKALYAAQAGVEDILVRLERNPGLGNPTFATNMTSLGETSYVATISSPLSTSKIATATGRFKTFEKAIEVQLASSAAQTSFTTAVQTGNGGFELLQNSNITCKAPCTEGNVYSNGDIKGVKKSPLASASRISGSAWAVGSITKLSENDSGARIEKNASASALVECLVVNDQLATAPGPSSGCPLSAGRTYTQTVTGPPELPLPAFDESYWKSQATSSAIGGGTWEGNCTVLSAGPDDCTNGTGKLGPQKINGSLFIPSNTNLTVTGAIWVVNNLNISSNNTIALDPSFVNSGTVVVSDGVISTGSNVTYASTGTAVIMIGSTKNDGLNCDLPAISVSSNTNNVIFYALNGCVNVAANSQFFGAIVGQKVRVSTNSTIEYDPALANAVFGASSAGGWVITSWREVE